MSGKRRSQSAKGAGPRAAIPHGRVYLVGAGPGDPGLLTVRGLACLRSAEVLVYDGLASPRLLSEVPANCLRIYAGKKHSPQGVALTQARINALLVEHGLAGKRVVRLKGGDPFVFGRGAEECHALREAGVAFEIVPGVSAATAVPAYAGIPLTARGTSASAVLVTGHEAGGKVRGAVDWRAIAGNQTIVLFMAWKKIASCVSELLSAGCDGATPAAAIRWGTTRDQRTAVTTLSDLPRCIDEEDIRPPMLVIIGEVVSEREALSWFESRPLFGKRIWLTRTSERGDAMAEVLSELGAEVQVAATTRMAPGRDSERAALRHELANIDRFRWLMLTSVNAVHALWAEVEQLRLDARVFASLRIAAVGGATEAALARCGLRADLVAAGGGKALAEALLAADPTPGPVLFPRAEDGRNEAQHLLQAASSEVVMHEVYRSEVAGDDLALRMSLERLRAGELDAVAFFAPSQFTALQELEPEAVGLLGTVPVLAAIGATTAEPLEAQGLVVNALAASPCAEDLVEAILAAFA